MKLNNFFHGDCLDLVNNLEDNFIDCVITSPPYFNSLKKYQRGSGYHYTQDIGEPLYLIYDICEALKTKIKEEAALCINLGYTKGS